MLLILNSGCFSCHSSDFVLGANDGTNSSGNRSASTKRDFAQVPSMDIHETMELGIIFQGDVQANEM